MKKLDEWEAEAANTDSRLGHHLPCTHVLRVDQYRILILISIVKKQHEALNFYLLDSENRVVARETLKEIEELLK